MKTAEESRELTTQRKAHNGAALVMGVGAQSGLGAGLARRFAREDLRVTISGRTPGRVERVAAQIVAHGGAVATKWRTPQARPTSGPFSMTRIATATLNSSSTTSAPMPRFGAGHDARPIRAPVAAERLWRLRCRAERRRGAIETQQKARSFSPAQRVLAGASPFLAFAAAKAALRAVAQGLAREFDSKGIHVAHIVIDGVIAGEYAATNFAD